MRCGGSRRISPSCRSCCVISTAGAKGAIGCLDFHFTLVLSAGGEPECATRGLNNRAAGAFVWIVHKLVEPNLRRRISLKIYPTLNEQWVQGLIAADPGILGLGDLVLR